jgi:transcriptional regulator with XRE-family HTH domain
MELKKAFGEALRNIRVDKKLTQEDFSVVSSRTYMSSLERGVYSPTIEKLDALASVLGIHPLTLLASSYLVANPDISAEALLKRVRAELHAIPKVVAPEPSAPDNA